MNSYAIWNNKGGVGKSTITFHIASRYAEKFQNKKVLVIDMYPQGNSSMMLLGGGQVGERKLLEYCTVQPIPKTVVGYLSEVICSGARAPLPPPMDFVTQIVQVNSKMPENLYLLCGDGNLEPMVPAINQAAAAPALTPNSDPWLWVHTILREFINKISQEDRQADWMVFVDTNPSFSIYTEIAISSVSRLIVPVNADDSSRVATRAMFTLLHGTNPPHPIYGSWTYATRGVQAHLDVPKIHIVVGNRLTQYQGPAQAFRALSDATADTLYNAYKANPERFTPRNQSINSIEEFRDTYSVPLRDFNTAGVVAAHLGQPLSKMVQGHHKVYNQNVLVVKQRITDCEDALDQIIQRL
ncbi:ATPase [Scytonema sp. HK-05]|nr:ATPase [Scytonema sp. HK-05]